MSIILNGLKNNGLSQSSLTNLKSIASQALGHGIGEGSNGGMGYMGVMKNADGTLSVFKCLTHSNEYKEFEKDEEHDYEKELKTASDNLKTMLRRLGREAGVDMEELERILNTCTNSKENYLSRKMVARAVTMIAERAIEGGDSKKFWKEVQFAGTVHDTSLKQKTSPNGASIEFTSSENQNNISLLAKVKAMDIGEVKNKLPSTIEELAIRIGQGNLGEELDDLLYEARTYITNNCPNVRACFSGDMDNNWLYDYHENEFYAHKTLGKPRPSLDLWENVRIGLFRLSLDGALDSLRKELNESNRDTIEPNDIKTLFKRAYVRSAYAYAGLKTACEIAEKRSLKCRFEDRINPETNKYSADYVGVILRTALKTVDEKFDNIEIDQNRPSTATAKKILAGDFEHDTDDNEKGVILHNAADVVAFIFSNVKYIDDFAKPEELKGSEFIDDTGKKNVLDDSCYSFNPYSNKNDGNGEEIVNSTYGIY